MPGTLQQILAQEGLDVRQDGRIARGVEPMAAVIHALSAELEAPGVATHDRLLLDDSHAGASPTPQLKGGAEPGRTSTQDDDVWLRHACAVP